MHIRNRPLPHTADWLYFANDTQRHRRPGGPMAYFDSGYNYRRGGFHLTWIIAAAIALFGVIKYLIHTQVNPVTGQTEHVAMTPTQEIALGLQAAPQMAL